MPSPRADGSTSSNRSWATVADFLTRKTLPTFSPSRSAIQQRSRLRVEVPKESRRDLRHQRLELRIPSILLGVERTVPLDHPAHVAGLVRPEEVRAARRGGAEEPLDRAHRLDQTAALAGAEGVEHGGHLVVRPAIERGEGLPSHGG